MTVARAGLALYNGTDPTVAVSPFPLSPSGLTVRTQEIEKEMSKKPKKLSELEAWRKILATIKEEVGAYGEMENGGLCTYIEHMDNDSAITEKTADRMKSRLLTARYTERMLCNEYRWEKFKHRPRLAFIRKVLREIEGEPEEQKG